MGKEIIVALIGAGAIVLVAIINIIAKRKNKDSVQVNLHLTIYGDQNQQINIEEVMKNISNWLSDNKKQQKDKTLLNTTEKPIAGDKWRQILKI